jgi:hypothetical protein
VRERERERERERVSEFHFPIGLLKDELKRQIFPYLIRLFWFNYIYSRGSISHSLENFKEMESLKVVLESSLQIQENTHDNN